MNFCTKSGHIFSKSVATVTVTLIYQKLNYRLNPNVYFATIWPNIRHLSQTSNNFSNLSQICMIYRRPKSRRSFHPSNTTAVKSDKILETRNIFHDKSRNLKIHDIFSNLEKTLIYLILTFWRMFVDGAIIWSKFLNHKV